MTSLLFHLFRTRYGRLLLGESTPCPHHREHSCRLMSQYPYATGEIIVNIYMMAAWVPRRSPHAKRPPSQEITPNTRKRLRSPTSPMRAGMGRRIDTIRDHTCLRVNPSSDGGPIRRPHRRMGVVVNPAAMCLTPHRTTAYCERFSINATVVTATINSSHACASHAPTNEETRNRP